MNANDLTFGIKDVVGIVLAVIALIGFIYALKRTAEKAEEKNTAQDTDIKNLRTEMEEKFLHAKNAKKANIQYIMDVIKQNKEDVEKKETLIYTRMEEIRKEQKEAHGALSAKMDGMNQQLQTINTNLSELTGYIKAKKEQ
jgi:hydroxylamine reductase (hybrid-cluster protein)